MPEISWIHGASEYHLYSDPKTWQEAKLVAESLGGKLVEIETEDENKNLFENIRKYISSNDYDQTIGTDGGGIAYIWLGGSDGDTTSTQSSTEWNWKWSNSNLEIARSREEWGTGWSGKEPDDSRGFQHRLAMGLEDWSRSNPGKYGYAGQWNDINAENKLFYVIEIPTTYKSNDINSSEGNLIYEGKFSDYKFYNRGNNQYEIKTNDGYDNITGKALLTFTGEESTSPFYEISPIYDIGRTFDQVTGLDTDSGRMFRLYNAAFKRLPDPDGLAYWIDNFSSGRNSMRVVTSSFLNSSEFQERYGANVSDSKYVDTLYTNVLGRLPDADGKNYWLGQLSSGRETREEALLGFAESAENKALFSEMTGVF